MWNALIAAPMIDGDGRRPVPIFAAMHDDVEKYMQQCLILAERALDSGNPPVGALIVFENTIIGTGVEAGRSTGDITNHAEILAVRDAIAAGHRDKLYMARMFTTHELGRASCRERVSLSV